ncbi:GntR family transcriptional regulator [Desulfosediminicola flagellatus]|uniref:GntR family transcriptional regulator n=1 Tax=Desulfosediminicola flagellatus TaxID=2569541 RepID=UPI0010AD56F9|nr:GntR family transcriptional regulator [Desulfosediminicola flagellatus]
MSEKTSESSSLEKREYPSLDKGHSLKDQVYEKLSSMLRKGELFPGSTIDQKKICKELNISRTPLNNALIRLDAEGIVTIHPRSRVTVNKLEEEDIQYLYEIIGTIESTLITKGCQKYSPERIKRMNALNAEMKSCIEDMDLTSYGNLHYEFHQIFIEMAPNVFAERILRPIKNRLWDFPQKTFPKQWYLNACAEHQMIIDALSEKDIHKAVSCLKDLHWNFQYNKEYIQKVYYL